MTPSDRKKKGDGFFHVTMENSLVRCQFLCSKLYLWYHGLWSTCKLSLW